MKNMKKNKNCLNSGLLQILDAAFGSNMKNSGQQPAAAHRAEKVGRNTVNVTTLQQPEGGAGRVMPTCRSKTAEPLCA